MENRDWTFKKDEWIPPNPENLRGALCAYFKATEVSNEKYKALREYANKLEE